MNSPVVDLILRYLDQNNLSPLMFIISPVTVTILYCAKIIVGIVMFEKCIWVDRVRVVSPFKHGMSGSMMYLAAPASDSLNGLFLMALSLSVFFNFESSDYLRYFVIYGC